jgi:DNA-3-methyladenine glycosylase II
MDYRKDPKLKKILQGQVALPVPRSNVTEALIWSIISQQLSVVVAKVLFERFVALFGNKFPSPAKILTVPITKIKSIGVSQQKAQYIHHVAQFILEHKITSRKLNKMSDEEIIDLLCQIKGVGRWTVEMVLIFGLGRKDVFAVDDLGIQKAMISIFKLHDYSKKELREKMIEISTRWSPHRTLVCLYLWNFSSSR